MFFLSGVSFIDENILITVRGFIQTSEGAILMRKWIEIASYDQYKIATCIHIISIEEYVV